LTLLLLFLRGDRGREESGGGKRENDMAELSAPHHVIPHLPPGPKLTQTNQNLRVTVPIT
jgi:hypothetical protein